MYAQVHNAQVAVQGGVSPNSDSSSRRFYYYLTGLLILALIANWILIVAYDVCTLNSVMWYFEEGGVVL